MAVVLLHHSGIRVAELLRYEHKGHAPIDQIGGVRVPKLMKSQGF